MSLIDITKPVSGNPTTQSVRDNFAAAAAEIDALDSAVTALQGSVSGFDSHLTDTNNPHAVTKTQIGLGNVDNTSDVNKPISTATQAALDAKQNTLTNSDGLSEGTTNLYFTNSRVISTLLAGLSTATNAVITVSDTILSALGKLQKQVSDNLTALVNHTGNTNNPHSVTKTQVGLSNVDNTSDLNKPVSTATQTALNSKADSSALSAHVVDTGNPHAVTKAQIGLSNVDNTSDLNKPISTATQVALDAKQNALINSDGLVEGTTNIYFTPSRVLNTVITGLSTATNAIITASDNVLSAIGKLQKQISDNLTTLTSHTSNTSNPHSSTASQVGAVAKAGDTLTGALNWSATQTIASAATTNIGAATSNSVIVSGTTTITGLGTIAAGAERVVQFSGALTLTHNATSLILPGGASITTAAGDVAYFVSLGSGNWQCTGYQKANGQAVVSGGGSPGGSTTQVQYNNAGVFAGDTGLTYDPTSKALTVGGATVTTSNPALVVNQTVNAGAVAFTVAKINVTNTASAATSKVLDVQVNAASVLSVDVKGGLTLTPDVTTYSGANKNVVEFGGGAPHGIAYQTNGYTAIAGNDGGGFGTKLQVNKYSRIQIPSSYTLGWSTSSITANATVDTGLTRNAAGVIEVNNGTAGTFRDLKLRSLIATSTITLGNVTVATLPTAASNTHAIVAVTDGNAFPTYRGAVTGGGSTKGVVYCDGSSWMWH